LKAFSLV